MLIAGLLLLLLSMALKNRQKHVIRFISFIYITLGLPQIAYKIYKIQFPYSEYTEIDVWVDNAISILQIVWLFIFVIVLLYVFLKFLWNFSKPKDKTLESSENNKAYKNKMSLWPGEIQGENIGCYIFGISGEGIEEDTYLSLAITKDELIKECREHFIESLEDINQRISNPKIPSEIPKELERFASNEMANRYKNDISTINSILNDTSGVINRHLSSGVLKPFAEIYGCKYFLDYGNRKRQKLEGKYLE